MICFRVRYFFIILSFLFIGCSCPKVNITQSEKEWVNHFKLGEKSIYYNGLGTVDTLIVTGINNYYTKCNRFELSKSQNEIYLIAFKLNSKQCYNGIEPFITVTAEPWKKRIPYIYFGNLGPRKINSENSVPVLVDTIINGLKLNSVYHYIKNGNTEQYGEKEYFVDFYWSKQIGLLAYTTVNGEFFVKRW